MKLILKKLDDDTNRYDLNGQIFQSFGGLYTALDMALAMALIRVEIDNLPDRAWTYNATNKTYEMDLEI